MDFGPTCVSNGMSDLCVIYTSHVPSDLTILECGPTSTLVCFANGSSGPSWSDLYFQRYDLGPWPGPSVVVLLGSIAWADLSRGST